MDNQDSSVYDNLVKKIVKAVPEIMELKVGVTFLERTNGSPYSVLSIDDDGILLRSQISERKKVIYRAGCYGDYQNNGRPITLEDILRALDIEEKQICVLQNGQFATFTGSNFYPHLEKWLLGKPLSDQPLETQFFLNSII